MVIKNVPLKIFRCVLCALIKDFLFALYKEQTKSYAVLSGIMRCHEKEQNISPRMCLLPDFLKNSFLVSSVL